MKTIPILATMAVGALLALSTHAQFAIDWFTIDAGGATSSGGAYSVSGTVGQPDAFLHCGEGHTLRGGFWGVLPPLPAPWLTLRRSGANVILAWPTSSIGFQLQQTAGLSGPATAWTDVSLISLVVGEEQHVTLPLIEGNRFFRLRKPCE